jgi:hypothetical protein
MNDNLLETRQLSNGTTLNLYDASCRQGADRWIVVMEARLEIPVNDRCLPPGQRDGLPLETIRKTLGPRVVYVSRKERIFVPDEDKADLLTAFQAEFCRNAVPYLLHPAFPPRFIIKQYRELQQKRVWQEAAATQPNQDLP